MKYSFHGFLDENEILLPPYTAVCVVSKTNKTMTVDVLDNYHTPKETTAPIMEIKPEAVGNVSNWVGA